jgi:hypothetical protein
MRTLMSFAALVVCCTTVALAGNSVPMFKAGNWDGDAYYDNQGNFQFCMITGSYLSGINLIFSVTADGTWQVMFNRPEGFSPQVQQRLDLYIDGRFVFGAPAAPVDQGLILMLPSTADLFQAMRVGHNLKVVTPGGSAGFNLTGTAAALAELLDCTRRLSRPTVAGLPPAKPARAFKQPSPQTASPELHKFPRDQVLTYAANVLSAADVRNYQFLPYEETNAMGDVAWRTEDGGIGASPMALSVFQQQRPDSRGDHAAIEIRGHLAPARPSKIGLDLALAISVSIGEPPRIG